MAVPHRIDLYPAYKAWIPPSSEVFLLGGDSAIPARSFTHPVLHRHKGRIIDGEFLQFLHSGFRFMARLSSESIKLAIPNGRGIPQLAQGGHDFRDWRAQIHERIHGALVECPERLLQLRAQKAPTHAVCTNFGRLRDALRFNSGFSARRR